MKKIVLGIFVSSTFLISACASSPKPTRSIAAESTALPNVADSAKRVFQCDFKNGYFQGMRGFADGNNLFIKDLNGDRAEITVDMTSAVERVGWMDIFMGDVLVHRFSLKVSEASQRGAIILRPMIWDMLTPDFELNRMTMRLRETSIVVCKPKES
jgi:hypothetical protein